MSIGLMEARRRFHRALIESGTLSINSSGVASNADKSQRLSRDLAATIAHNLGAAHGIRKLDRKSVV